MDDQHPDMDFLSDLSKKFDRDQKVRTIVSTAMSKACRLMASPGTRREKAIEVARILQTAEEAIIGMLDEREK